MGRTIAEKILARNALDVAVPAVRGVLAARAARGGGLVRDVR